MDDPPIQPPDTAPPGEGAGGARRRLADGLYALGLARSPEEVFQAVLASASGLEPAAHWYLGRIEERGGRRELRLAAAGPALLARLGTTGGAPSFPLFEGELVREVCDQQRSCLVAEVADAPAMAPPAGTEATALRSLLGLPLVFEGRLVGALFAVAFRDEAPLHPTPDTMATLEGWVQAGALALGRMQAETRLAATAFLFRDLARAVRDLAGASDEDLVAARLFQWAPRLAPLPEWWFNRFDPSTRTCVTTHWTRGVEAYGTVEDIRRPDAVDGDPILERIHLRQKAVHIRRWEDLPSKPGRGTWPIHTWVGLPLAHEGSVVGSLSGGSLGDQGHAEVSEEQFEALQSLAEAAGLVLNRLQARKALEAQETRFRLLFERSPDAIALLTHGLIQDVNQASVDLLGHPRSALLGADPTQLSPARQPSGTPSREAALALLAEVRSGLRNRFEWTFLHASGHEIPCEVAITQYVLGPRHIYHAVLRDLSALKQGEAERAALERQLFQAQKLESLGVLAGGIAHDFNNLLMGVLGHAGLALEQLPPDHPLRRNLESIQKAGLRAADLTRQMLAYSGRGQFVVRPLDLAAQVEEMLHLLEVSIPKAVTLDLRLERDLPPVMADASQIQQVIMNLVINAAEAIGEARGTISLATSLRRLDGHGTDASLMGRDTPEGDYVCLEVSDTGCGMDEATKARIFEPFFTTKFTGRGLGLSAILGIVRGHQGTMRVYSEVGRGTVFRVLFPAHAGTAQVPAFLEPGGDWEGHGLILVVDDDETVRAVARQTLERRGFRVLEAGDGQEAVDRVREYGAAIGLVILDMTMPRMDGETAFREMRRVRPDIRVVLSSGYSETEAMTRFMGKGLRGFIQKPYGPRDLLAKIRDVLEA